METAPADGFSYALQFDCDSLPGDATQFLTSVSESVKELDPASLTNAQLAALAALAQQVEWTLQEREIAAQREAAEFLEDWQPAIELFKDAARVPTPLGIEAVRSITIEAQRKGTNTEQSLGIQRSTFESVQAGSEKPLPTHIYFKCVPYQGLGERTFVLRLGVITGEPLKVVLRIINREQHDEEMAAELAALVRQALTDLPVLLGTYSRKD
jgi:uncharacterized protein YfdQ (DUF2303 family)